MRILVADDERMLCAALKEIIEKNKHTVFCAYDGKQALEMYKELEPDLILLDVMMPEKNGFDVCREIREQNQKIPIMFLSGKHDIVDKSIGFSAGGDDYVTKPFNGDELILRIEAALRRTRVVEDASVMSKGRAQTSIGDLDIHFKRSAVHKNGKRVELSPKEFQILALLANHPGEVYSKTSIIENIWGDEYTDDSISVAVFIRKIREKIEDDPSKPLYIQTVWRSGYRFCDNDNC